MRHNQHPRTNRRPALAAIGISLCLATQVASTFAADKTWDGGGDQTSWSASPDNWDLNTAPVANDSLFFDGAVGLFTFNDFPADTDFAGITFNVGASSFFLTGAEVDLIGGVTNLSPNLQTISHNLDQTANRNHHAVGDMLYDGAVKNNTLFKYGPGTITLGGSLDNSSLRAQVYAGVIALAKTGNRSLGGSPIVASDTGILRIVGPGTDQIHFNQRVVVTNGGTFQIQNSLEEIGALSGSTDATGIIENGLDGTIATLVLGGGSGHEGIYNGLMRDGAAGQLNLRVYRADNRYVFNGTHTYSGFTDINNTAGAGTARMIMNGTHTGGGDYTVNGHASIADRFAALGGSGNISATVVNVNIRGTLSPGGALDVDFSDSANFSDTIASLTFSNAVNLNDATATLEIQLNGTSAGTTYDQVKISGSGTISNNNSNLKLVMGFTPGEGDQFTIVDVEGTDSSKTMGEFAALNGTATILSQGSTFIEPTSGKTMRISYRAEGTTFDAGNGNNIMIEVVASGGANLTWRGDADNKWDVATTSNWRTSGDVATTFANGDNVTFNNSGSNSAPIDLTTDLSPGNIMVDSANNYVFATSAASKLTGTIVLTKTNTGTLTILTDNDNAGSTLVRQGTLRVGTNGTAGLLSGALDISTGASVIFDRSDTFTNSSSITGTGTIVNNSTNGTLILAGNSTFSGTTLVNAGTLQFGVGVGSSGSINGTVANNATVAYSFDNAVTINNSLSGTGLVNLINTSATSRRFTIGAGVNNLAFTGRFNVGPLACLTTPDLSAGTNQLGVGSTVYVEDTGSVLLDRGGTYLSTFYIQGAGNGAGNAGTPVTLEIEGISPPTTIAGNVNVLSSTTIGGFIGTSRISGRLVDTNGVSTITFANGRGAGTSFILQLGSVSGPNHWADTIIDPDLSGGAFTVTAMTPNAISTNGLTMGANGRFALNGNNHTVGYLLSTAAGGIVLNSSATTAAVLTVGADNSTTSFYGAFNNGGTAALGLTKVGTGTLICDGDSTCTGPVTIQGGTLSLTQIFGSGSFSNASVFSIASGAILDVSTRVDGTLTLNSGQTLKHSGSSTGPITVTGSVNLGNGTLLLGLNRTGLAHDSLAASGSVTYSGTLAVTNTGAALQAGDKFQLFPSAVSGFTAYALPATDVANLVQYTWQNDVATDGSVTVQTVAPLTPPTLGVSQAGNTLTFTWSGTFKLQAQTNSLATGLSNNWGDYPGGSSSGVNVPIDPANPTVFFRLSLP